MNINGQQKREHFCVRCRRRFVEVMESDERFAAFPAALDFEPLALEVTVRWLNERCPGRELTADVEAYTNRPRR